MVLDTFRRFSDNNVCKHVGIIKNLRCFNLNSGYPYQYVLSAHGTNLTDLNHSLTDLIDEFLYSNYWLAQNCKSVDLLLCWSWHR